MKEYYNDNDDQRSVLIVYPLILMLFYFPIPTLAKILADIIKHCTSSLLKLAFLRVKRYFFISSFLNYFYCMAISYCKPSLWIF